MVKDMELKLNLALEHDFTVIQPHYKVFDMGGMVVDKKFHNYTLLTFEVNCILCIT